MVNASFEFGDPATSRLVAAGVVVLIVALIATAALMLLNRKGMRVLFAELREYRKRRLLTPAEVAAQEAVGTYALLCFFIVMSNIVRFGHLKEGTKRSAHRAEQQACTAIKPGRDTATLYFSCLQDSDIAHLSTWLASTGRATPEAYAAFLREERNAAQANRFYSQDHVLRRLRVGQP
jgi:hypothetical protein